MAEKLLFLSHIHEESALALLFKEAIESEFGGFVEVFVSSDGTSIPAGSNFLRRIEDGLVSCIGALYLISPMSVKRPWISFELGAVWVRNSISLRADQREIPAIPICHSGMTLGGLPTPINHLNAIQASDSQQLERAFIALQSAVGGKGQLKTDFSTLRERVALFERKYTVGAHLSTALNLMDRRYLKAVLDQCKKIPPDTYIDLNWGLTETEKVRQLQALEKTHLKGLMELKIGGAGFTAGESGALSLTQLNMRIKASLIFDYEQEILVDSKAA
ncbi:hypothetical protein CKY39_07795 [Variovorax boronicumulans]|uniref:Uncharacterized protein n=1 Tax=Variovorax boronicumulans TaxID=436515 RepID=A0A250DGM1_9BURK|nr:TIR domain-containing protein [Variovorax boronicumulans]ATA53123.1 hypothetical protein CKY39_07795 [Variovorax boronicumulans]